MVGPILPGSTAPRGEPRSCSTPRAPRSRPPWGYGRDEVSFTASGTAAVHAGVLGGLAGHGGAGATLVHSAVEHSSVLHAARHHVAAGGDATAVPVDRWGRIDLAAWRAAVSAPGVALAALISASHEVGTVQPVTEAAEACAAAGVPLLVDAAQSVGRAPGPRVGRS